jgi:predicted RNA-binding Zn-ribbon protein involved in translation (DUF1610 family)
MADRSGDGCGVWGDDEREESMSRESLNGLSLFLLVLSVLFAVVAYIFGINSLYTGISVMFVLSIVIAVLASYAKPEPTEWQCQKCGERLVRSQIKFGLCPKCGTKVEGFRGMKARGSIV